MTEILQQFLGRELSAFELAHEAFAIADRLSPKQVRLRDEDGVKELLEEVLPLAVFAKSLEGPESHVWIKYLGRNEPCDAIGRFSGALVERGFREGHQKLEVTSAIAPYEYLQREALVEDGVVFGDPNIYREGSRHRGGKVVNVPTVRDGSEYVDEACEWVADAIRKKSSRIYSQPCTLLVGLKAGKPLALQEWCSVVETGYKAGHKSGFSAGYLVDTFSNSCIFKAW